MPTEPRQIRLFALLFVVVVALFAALWFFVLRTEYVPVYENIRESDASQIVAELEDAGIAYQLANDGHDILVPQGEAADARVAVAGANISMGGTTGFELFNENELGLTEFAQKINLQRAIQGELARTIMMMEGVEFARVHLALPERTLFRSEQETPTAAVTVEMQAAQTLTSSRVDGIRQLVASSVPGLSIADVAVLDDGGDLVSAALTAGATIGAPAQNEREALENLVSIRAKDAISQVLPQQSFDLGVSAFEQVEEVPSATEESPEAAEAPAQPRAMFGLEGRSLRVMIRTPQALSPEERSIISGALADSIGLSSSNGDVLDFTTGALASATAPAPASAPSRAEPAIDRQAAGQDWTSPAGVGSSFWTLPWLWLAIPLAILLLALFAARPRRQLSESETEDFAELLRGAALNREPS